MAGERALPLELWYTISESLPFRDLWNLTLACKTLHSCFSKIVYARCNYLQKHYKVLDDYEDHHHSHQGSSTIGQALDLIFHRELPPAFIEGIKCDEVPHHLQPGDYPWGSSVVGLDHGEVLRQAIETSPWIDEHEHWLTSQLIARGDEEVALCLLLPMLSNLRELLTFSAVSNRVHDFVARIARSGNGAVLPKLEKVSSASCINEFGVPLLELAGYAALPSVRTVLGFNLSSNLMNGFEVYSFNGWPPQLPRSKASRVVIDGYISQAEFLQFAEGFRGPCIITQNCDEFSYDCDDLHHYHLEITARIDPNTGDAIAGTRHVSFHKDDDVQDPSIRRHKNVATAYEFLLYDHRKPRTHGSMYAWKGTTLIDDSDDAL